MKQLAWLVPGLLLGVAGCPDVKTDPGEGVGDTPSSAPVVEFDPTKSIIPFPNNLVRDPTTGKVNLPEQCNEGPVTAAVRTKVLNTLDGFGTYEVGIQVTFSSDVNADSVEDHIVLYKRSTAGTDVAPASAVAVPVQLVPATTIRFADQTDIKHCTGPKTINAVNVIPLVPLEQKSTYDVAVLDGVTTADGTPYTATFFWSLVRQETDPVELDTQGNVLSDKTPLDPNDPAQLAQLQGIDQLWKAHAKELAFLTAIDGTKLAREKLLLAWEFTTQTVTDPLDPTVAGSPASAVDQAPLVAVQSVLAGATPTQFYEARVGTNVCQSDGGSLPCQAVGDIIGGVLASNTYQVDQPPVVTTSVNNPNEGGPIPGAWSDPVHPTKVGTNGIQVFGMIPATPAPAGGYPVVIFGHGLGSSKTTLVAIGSQLAALGFASVAIDFVAHDSRAVRISNTGTCADTGTTPPPPTERPDCYAPFLSTDLAVTRDNIRQSILDLHELYGALVGCGLTNCGELKVDATRINYMGLSLGGIMGSTAVASKGGFKAAVLNVPAVGWVDVLENSQTDEIKCPLVDALIDAGLLTGDKWNPVANTGLCTTDAWLAQPGYQQFRSIARWALDPADGANFTPKLAMRRILIQEVVGDTVVPNVATDREGALVGLTPKTADPGVQNPNAPPPFLPTAALAQMPLMNQWFRYPTLPAAGSFPGNTFAHASLLRPATNDAAGALATARIQTDALFFLSANNQ